MHALSLNPGIQIQSISVKNGELRQSNAAPNLSRSWSFNFNQPLRSFCKGVKVKYVPAIAAEEAVLRVEEKVEENYGNLVFRTLHVDESLNEQGRDLRENHQEKEEENKEEEPDCEDSIQLDKDSISKMLKKVSLLDARLYAKLVYLGGLAYGIPEIKPENLLRIHGLRMVTSSLEKKKILALKAEKDKLLEQLNKVKVIDGDIDETETAEQTEQVSAGIRSAAYGIVASAVSYLHSRTKRILGFKSTTSKELKEEIRGAMRKIDMINQDMASLMATTDAVTKVVAANEEVKQAVADDLNSIASSPCEWFTCDDEQCATRYFVIQGSESLSSWQANLLFEPVKFEGLDFPVHRGIYEAAKGIYQQMLPEILSYLKIHGQRATFRFTGHSLGGSLALLVNLMLLIRDVVPRSSLLPVVTFGAPSVMCGGDGLLRHLGLPKNHLRSISMHRDIVPRIFSCRYPNHVCKLLKAVNSKFRNHPCLEKQQVLYNPMGEFLILQPDSKYSPSHDLLPSGSGLYVLSCPAPDLAEAENQIQAAQSVFMNSPHPLEILSSRGAYGSSGSIRKNHDSDFYLKFVRTFIHNELVRIRKLRRERLKKSWWPKSLWPLVAPQWINAGLMASRGGNQGHTFDFPGFLRYCSPLMLDC